MPSRPSSKEEHAKDTRIIVPIAIAITGLPLTQATALEGDQGTGDVVATQVGNVVRWDFPDSLDDSTTRVVAGQKVNNGCSYVIAGHVTNSPPEGSVYIDRGIEEDLEACQLTIESGSIARSEIPHLLADNGVPTKPRGAENILTTNLATGGDAAGLMASSYAWVKTGYEDPVNIDVTWTKSEVSWEWNGGCVTASWGHQGYYGYAAGSGWVYDNSWHDSFRGCSYARTRTYGLFHNDGFCWDDVTTWNEYNTTQIFGYPNGTYSYDINSAKWGGCANLLTPYVLHGQ